MLPFGFLDGQDSADLWDYPQRCEDKTGGRVLAIPHNGNLSQGLMFAVEQMDGSPLDAAYAERRMRWEPLAEVTQIKGDGEAHPALPPDDAFADYYTWDAGDFGLNPKEPEMLAHEYSRSALKLGLEQEAALGANPFKFGMIGATDSHTSLATTREDNFFGKFSGVEPSEHERYLDLVSEDLRPNADGSLNIYHWEAAASGLAGVWARENTRAAIWDAMACKEVYASTGSRMTVRVFAGWDFEPAEVHRPDFATQGYQRGDPDGANLDRIQIVKGWLDRDEGLKERIYDVAVSDGRTIDGEGRATEAVGSTVDVENASYTNMIGAAALAAHWVDPDFSIRPSAPSTMSACWKSRLRAGLPMTSGSTASATRRPRPCASSRTAPIPRRSGIRRKVKAGVQTAPLRCG